MRANPLCPVCDTCDWEVLWSKIYRLEDADRLDPYLRGKYQTLFATWCRGQTEAELHSMMCRRCGFISVGPRPTEQELDEKYRFAATLTLPSQWLEPDDPRELRRARGIYRTLRRHLRRKPSRILDFGGHDGRLLRYFIEAGHTGLLLDYARMPLPGVQHIGQTLDELNPAERFDAIIASNVLEHLAEPRRDLEQLRAHLTADGVLYVEVPLEMYGQAKLPADPVMHVNFFTPENMAYLLERAGFAPLFCRLGGVDAGTFCRLAVRSVARIADKPRTPDYSKGPAATRRYLKPNLLLRLRRALFFPRRIPQRLIVHLRSRFRS